MGWSWQFLVSGGRFLVVYDVGKEVVMVGGGDGGGVRPNKAREARQKSSKTKKK